MSWKDNGHADEEPVSLARVLFENAAAMIELLREDMKPRDVLFCPELRTVLAAAARGLSVRCYALPDAARHFAESRRYGDVPLVLVEPGGSERASAFVTELEAELGESVAIVECEPGVDGWVEQRRELTDI